MKNVVESFLNNNNENLFCVDDLGSYTYNEAISVAKSIACALSKKGINKQPIMLKANRDNKTLITILAIILSNNYYVPVNPDFSDEKIEYIIETSNIKYEICFEESTTKTNHLFFNELIEEEINENVINNLKNNFDENNNIYVIYTSGSTGKPKGVLKTQKNIISFVNNFIATFNFNEKLNIANQAPLFFDASMKDVYLAIATGSTLYFPNKTLFAMPSKLIEYLNDNKINYICWVPSALTIIVRLNTFKYIKPEYLKYVFFVGEVFMPKYLNIWIREVKGVKYANLYGSTELAGVCLYKIIDSEVDECTPIPLGKPLVNNKVYLVEGEITVESDQIATCYLNDEEKNKQVFIEYDNKRILKTGDYGYINEDNDIVFATRKDFQIKHMGYRVELQEIEIYLTSLNYVSNCAVLFDSNKDKIVSFVSLNKEIESPVKNIINDLKNKLPDYMVPNIVKVLDELPLNANGKIDRNKLKEYVGV